MTLPSRTTIWSSLIVLALVFAAYVYATGLGSSLYTTAPLKELPTAQTDLVPSGDIEATERTLVLAGGCFWCTEAVYEQLQGVKDVVSGYAGGTEADADYETVSAGLTDHAECVQITYDPSVISFGQLLQVYFTTAHDPTQKDRQGPDVGRQYRSTIFYRTEDERRIALAYIDQLNEAGVYPEPIVTTLEPLDRFYPAEEYHQDYATKHPYNFYVRRWSLPKVRKTHEHFPDLVRTSVTTINE